MQRGRVFQSGRPGRSVVSVFLVAAVATIVPALGILFHLLNRYEGYFEDARVFFALIVGFFVGLVVAFLEVVAFRFDSAQFIVDAGYGTAVVLFVVGYAFVEAAAKTAVLGTAKFRKRKDTPYYGAALGTGFGAMVALQAVAARFTRIDSVGWHWNAQTVTPAILVVALAIATLLVQAAAGVWIGRGCADGRLWRGLTQGAFVQMPLFGFLWIVGEQGNVTASGASLAALVYGLVLVTVTQRRILDRVVPQEIRDQVLRERRREARRESRTGRADETPDSVALETGLGPKL